MDNSMKCIQVKNNQCVVDWTSIPSPQKGEILIQVSHAGINRPDLVQKQGFYPPPAGASDILGLEVSGVVVKGDDVFKKGDKVCALLAGGGYAEYVAAPSGQCLKIPKGWTFQEAAALPETLFTVWSNIGYLLEKDKKILIHGGSSGIGSTAIQLAKLFGLKIATTVRTEEKALYCQNLGADRVIRYTEDDFETEIENLWGKNSVDIILDMVGGDYFPKNLRLLAHKGHHITLAMLKGKDSTIDLRQILTKHLTLKGSTLRPRSVAEKTAIRDEIQEKLGSFLDAGKLKPFIFKEFALDDVEKAFELLEKSDHHGKIVLKL